MWAESRRRLSSTLGKQRLAQLDAVLDDPDIPGPDKARAVLEAFAPLDAMLLVSMRHAADPDKLESHAKSTRLVAAMAQHSLSVVGLRSGTIAEYDASDRLGDLLTAFRQAPSQTPAALPAAPTDTVELADFDAVPDAPPRDV